MDSVAVRSAQEREDLFRDAAERAPVTLPGLIEKDFWACWVLRRLMRLDQGAPLIFKGGTSLAKGYGVIHRFSEDIDLSLDRTCLGFDEDLWRGLSGKQERSLIGEISRACSEHVDRTILPALTEDLAAVLGPPAPGAGWSLARSDAEDASLLFTYPATVVTLAIGGYTAPRVLLEFGARADHWPEDRRPIQPYAAEAFPEEFEEAAFEVRTLHIHRTFWEKATILHSLAHGGAAKVRPRMARHYYDLVQIAASDEGVGALERLDLLSAVAQHKQRFFPSGWASYESAAPGTLRLAPPQDVAKELRRDYAAMSPLFIEEPPGFEELLARLEEIEARVNHGLAKLDIVPPGRTES